MDAHEKAVRLQVAVDRRFSIRIKSEAALALIRCEQTLRRSEKRIAEACKEAGLHFYLQTDPRGCVLYVSDKPMTDSGYSMQGIPCC
jgi:hypothetical protein